MLSTKSLLNKRLLKNPLKKVFPSKQQGNDGDLQLARISGKGEFLLGKIDGNWFSTKLTSIKDSSVNKSKKIKTSKLYGLGGLALTLVSESISTSIYAGKTATSKANSQPILKIGNGKNTGIVSSLGNQDLLLTTGNSTSSYLNITDGSNGSITSVLNGSGKFDVIFNSSDADDPRVRVLNVGSGGSSLDLIVSTSTSDSYIAHGYIADDPSNNRYYVSGIDNTSPNSYNINFTSGSSAGNLTPSNGTNLVKISNDGDMTLLKDLFVTGDATVDGGRLDIDISSGDPKLVFQIGGTSKFTLGLDDSDSDKFKINSGSTIGDSSDLELDSSGNFSVAGTLTIGDIDTDTEGDNYLVEVSGEVKKRTPAQVLSDIGAQASGSYITGSGSLSAQDLTDIGNLSGTNTGDQVIPNNFLRDDADDTTSGTITAAGFTTTGTWTFDDATSGTVGITTVHTGSSFTDNDTSLMTAGAIKEKIEAYGYSTTSGDITGVTAGDGLSGGGSSGGVSLAVNVDDSTIETNSDTLRVKDSGITLAKMADIADDRILGRYDEGSSGAPIALTASTVRAFLNVADGATANTGDITGVTITTDSGGGSAASDTGGSADFSILGSNGVGVTNSGTTITAVAVPGEIDHDSLNNFVTNEHIDWTSASAGTIHATNYTNTTYSVMASGNSYAAGLVAAGSGTHGNEFLRKDGTWVVPENDNTNQLTTFTVSATTDSNATTISQGDDLMFAAGTGITCETTADGTVTISSTVTDTNTTYSAGSLLDLSTTTFNVDLTELTDGTADVVGSADELVYLDDGVQKRKQIDEIKLGQFNNDQGWTSNTGDITGVDLTGGTGISIDSETNTTSGSYSSTITCNLEGTELKSTGETGTTKFLRVDGDNSCSWQVPPDTNTNQLTTFTLTADSGSNQTIEHGNTLDIAGSSPIVTAVGATDTVTVSLDDPANLSELNESTDATDDKILLWDESGSAWKYMTLDNLQDSIDTTGGGGGGGSNYITDDADDTMAGTLTIDKDSTATTTGTVLGLDIDVDQTGIVAAAQSLSVYGARISVNDDAPTHVQGHYPIGIYTNVTSNKTGTSLTMGLYNVIKGADTDYGIVNTIGEDGDGTTGTIGISQTVTNDGLDYIQKSSADGGDYFSMKTIANGETTLATVDDDGTKLANLHMEIQGFVEFDGCGVGFDLVTPTYNATDTDVDFRTGNKQMVTLTGNITDLNLYFPSTSGNFTLLIKQDGTGSRAITNYKAFDNLGTASGSSTVLFSGGSNPTLTTTASKVDILSFFWDADNEIAYGVATVNF